MEANRTKFLSLGLCLSVYWTQACVHKIPLTAAEKCAQNDMAVGDLVVSEGKAETSARCEEPEDTQETCKVEKLKDAASYKESFNGSTGWKNTLITLGYIALIVPGVVLSIAFKSHASFKESRAESLADKGKQCPLAGVADSDAESSKKLAH